MILDWKKIASEIRVELAQKISSLERKPKLVVILLGENPASLVYVRQKKKFALEVGMEFELRQFDVSLSEKELLGEIHILNNNPDVSGYLIQLPLPPHINEKNINESIDPKKDVDGFTPYNIGCLSLDTPERLDACTPKWIMKIFAYYHIDIRGKNITIIGRSNIVGKPLALMCINAGATVTICNSQTKDIKSSTLNADIIVCAVGKPKFLTKDMVRPGSIIIDVGITRIGDALSGDTDYEELESENYITPVPGGVGPMTVAMLLENTYLAHIRNHQ